MTPDERIDRDQRRGHRLAEFFRAEFLDLCVPAREAVAVSLLRFLSPELTALVQRNRELKAALEPTSPAQPKESESC